MLVKTNKITFLLYITKLAKQIINALIKTFALELFNKHYSRS